MEPIATGKFKSGGKSGMKRRNKKEASEWFQSLSHIEQLLVKQEANASSSSKERKPKKEMHERERELLLKRRSEHEARMKAQLQSKAEITKQIQKCQEMRRQLIPLQMRLEQVQLHEYYNTPSSSKFYLKLGNMKANVSYELQLIHHEEKALFEMLGAPTTQHLSALTPTDKQDPAYYAAQKEMARRISSSPSELTRYLEWRDKRLVADAMMNEQLKTAIKQNNGKSLDWAGNTKLATKFQTLTNDRIALSMTEANTAAELRAQQKSITADTLRQQSQAEMRADAEMRLHSP